LVKSNRLARRKLAGDQTHAIPIHCKDYDCGDSESESKSGSETAVKRKHSDKENSRMISRNTRTQPDSEAARFVRKDILNSKTIFLLIYNYFNCFFLLAEGNQS
jgi:hypothetical protein